MNNIKLTILITEETAKIVRANPEEFTKVFSEYLLKLADELLQKKYQKDQEIIEGNVKGKPIGILGFPVITSDKVKPEK